MNSPNDYEKISNKIYFDNDDKLKYSKTFNEMISIVEMNDSIELKSKYVIICLMQRRMFVVDGIIGFECIMAVDFVVVGRKLLKFC